MTGRAAGFGLTVLVAFGITVGYTGWKMRTSFATSICEHCGRSSASRGRTVGLDFSNEKEVFCCPTCALTASLQRGRALHILEFTDYYTRTGIAPEEAYLVYGSDVNFCVRDRILTDQYRLPAPIEFDRCAPSIVAFAANEAAESFMREHGGTLLRFDELQAVHAP